YERDICDGIAQGVTGHAPFTLHFEGIKHFPDKKTIYLDPVEKGSIAALRKSVRTYLRSDKRLRKLGVHATSQPHLTIARHLKSEQFGPAWE
ncbi:2'-5' RNA ligase family protein, partial [Salmonella sp. SAL4457]|uniref:2'-5' RNA ligase family protein n=1 Tax=Salmonella sp. SAL4457 TaxID=3159912 RepID=UPI00397A1184